jgi:hypothetical protein
MMENPFKRPGRGDPYGRRRVTPEGEPLEVSGSSRPLVRIMAPIIVGIIIISVVSISSIRIVDAGNRGILLHFVAVAIM